MADMPRKYSSFAISTVDAIGDGYVLVQPAQPGAELVRISVGGFGGGGSSNTALEWHAPVKLGTNEGFPLTDGDVPMFVDYGEGAIEWTNVNLFEMMDNAIAAAIEYAPWKALFFSSAVDPDNDITGLNFNVRSLKVPDAPWPSVPFDLLALSGRVKLEFWAQGTASSDVYGGEKTILINYDVNADGSEKTFGDVTIDGFEMTIRQDTSCVVRFRLGEDGHPNISLGRLMLWFNGSASVNITG